ncbi:hypothetical protein EJB05_06236 [Eragrostis curvula]|uniref:Uncharacterized protein n=1 Tax=Eragrostis curvula TaxID=38414 RepID=A0A5J9WFE8_9POAL|nr:hypothetical protein EJB05_06236 [Eragrostis curvula]
MTTAPCSGICPAHLTVILSIFCPTCCLSGYNSQPMVCSIKSSPFLQKDSSRSVPLPPGTRRHLELSLPELIEIRPIDLIISEEAKDYNEDDAQKVTLPPVDCLWSALEFLLLLLLCLELWFVLFKLFYSL